MGTTDLDCGKRESRVTQFTLPSVIRAVLKVTYHTSFRMDVRRQFLDGFPCKVTLNHMVKWDFDVCHLGGM